MSLNDLSPIVSNMELTHLGWKPPNYMLSSSIWYKLRVINTLLLHQIRRIYSKIIHLYIAEFVNIFIVALEILNLASNIIVFCESRKFFRCGYLYFYSLEMNLFEE